MNDTAKNIERLLRFGERQGMLRPLDTYIARNALLDLFQLTEPYSRAIEHEQHETPTELLELLLDDAAQRGLFDAEISALRVNFEARIMGALMPRESEVAEKFAQLYQQQGAKAATDYFYHLCIVSNYIRTAQIAKNIKWDYSGRYGTLEITINLTKPEKDPKTIALERSQPAAGYPQCMLCIENIGYAGRVNFPARQNHRVVPITLCEQPWYLQYSPYVYYNEHCIVFEHAHAPMKITEQTFAQLLSFVQQFPHYTCGSNADLPIVGGSILSHMHFQGGRYEFPMQRAQTLARFVCDEMPALSLESICWPVSTLRVSGHDAQQLLRFAGRVLQVWRQYSDEQVDILAFTEQNGERTAHNTITPIMRYDEQRGYILDLVPRNNRTSEEYPDGIFHPHREIHHIKKENIGLIEVMGLAILPGRLEKESAEIVQVLCGRADAVQAKQKLPVHAQWIDELCTAHGTALSEQQAQEVVRAEIGAKFEACLEHAGVFKQTDEGQAAFARFMEHLGCRLA